jgi:hypothetical protein
MYPNYWELSIFLCGYKYDFCPFPGANEELTPGFPGRIQEHDGVSVMGRVRTIVVSLIQKRVSKKALPWTFTVFLFGVDGDATWDLIKFDTKSYFVLY